MAKEKKKNEPLMDYKSQEPLIGPIDRNRNRQFGSYAYLPEYVEIVYKLLSESDTAKTKSHLCYALQCSKDTLLRWMKKFPEFNEAVVTGMEIGKMKWRDRIAENAFEPSATVNNGLIKLLSSNVYGIKDDAEPVVIINNNNISPEEEMKKRGLPVPKVEIKDVDDE
jgi:acyl-CoA synthetase (AMP-forming)/AMP-acid ligase II